MSTQSFETETDRLFFTKLYESIKRIFSTQRQQWSCEEIIRFLALIKVETKLETIFYEFKITGQLLFDAKYLWSQIKNYLDEKTYFPIMKLLYVVLKINTLENRPVSNIKFVKASPQNNGNGKKWKNAQKQEFSRQVSVQGKSPKVNTSCTKIQSSQTLKIQKPGQREFPDLQQPECQVFDSHLNYLSVQGEILQGLQKQFKKLGQSLIADLSFNQLARIFKSTQVPRAIELSQLIKKYSIDGYCIICLFADRDTFLQEIKTFFSNEEISQFEEILNLILPFYYKQMFQPDEREANKFTFPQLNGMNINFFSQKSNTNLLDDPSKNSNLDQSFGTSEMGTSQMGTSEMGTSQIYGESQAGSVQGSVDYGISQQYNGGTQTRQSMGRSSMGRSEMGNSVSYAQSQYDTSECGMSEAGSIGQSMGESLMGESIVFKEPKQKIKDVRASSVEDIGIIHRLQEVSLRLPFNLFKMDPLQNIKITSLTYPFTINFDKPKTHEQFVRNVKQGAQKMKQCATNGASICERDFNITGAKFGRSQQNDYRYPDELSISAKHAQIGFWNDRYQLVDLQSKTGTFLYIPMTRPLVLKDEQIIQLSNEIQIVVHILKKQAPEGTIKLEFTKPQNEPFYKATLKQGQTLKIGRSQKSHIKLSQQSISSKHTQIRYQNGQFKINDCLSPAGTWLRLSKKGVKSQMFPLQQGDIIRISSKKAYLINEITNGIGEDSQEEQYEEMMQYMSNPDYKILRENSEDNFNQIIEKAMKRKTPYEKNIKSIFRISSRTLLNDFLSFMEKIFHNAVILLLFKYI